MQEKHVQNVNISLGWAQAIKDAKLQIKEHQVRIRSLQRVIRVFKKSIETGEPWPGESKAGS